MSAAEAFDTTTTIGDEGALIHTVHTGQADVIIYRHIDETGAESLVIEIDHNHEGSDVRVRHN